MMSDDTMQVILGYSGSIDLDQILGFLDRYYIALCCASHFVAIWN